MKIFQEKFTQYFVTVDDSGKLTASYPSPSAWDYTRDADGNFILDQNGNNVPSRPAGCVSVSPTDFAKLQSGAFKMVEGVVVSV